MPRVVGLVIALLVLSSFPGVARVGATTTTTTTTAQESTPAASPAGCPMTDEAENEARARRWFEEALNGRDLDVLDELLADAHVHHGATFPDAGGPEASKRILGAILNRFSDARHTVDQAVAAGDRVALRWTGTGTHDGEFQGIAPTGRRVTWTGINLYRIACGRIVEVWSETDGLGRLQQLGVLSAATPAAASPVATATGSIGTPAAAEGCPTGDAAAHEALVRRWWDEGWSGGDLDALDEVLAVDHVHHWAVGPDTAGVDAVEGRLGEWRAAFPDLRVTVEDVIADDDLVAARWAATGTNDDPYQGAAPTGQAVEWQGINLFLISCGRIVEIWSEMDTLGLRAQLGVPVGAGTPAP